jgi:hypothetical protein
MIPKVNVFCCLILLLHISDLSAKEVRFSAAKTDTYHLNLLTKALSYFPQKNYSVTFIEYNQKTPKPRLFTRLSKGQRVDVINGSATPERESKYRAIYFPTLKGVREWHIPIVSKSNASLFSKVNTLQQLKSLVPIQLNIWPSIKIFEHNGIKVASGSNYKGLFLMLTKGRADYFPRSIFHVNKAISNNKNLDIMLDPYTLIKYPSAYYFYVNKDNVELANDIEKGLNLALADGSFDTLFNSAFGDIFKPLSLSERKVFNLNNPNLLN